MKTSYTQSKSTLKQNQTHTKPTLNQHYISYITRTRNLKKHQRSTKEAPKKHQNKPKEAPKEA
jgi:hypothetical protein